MYGCTNVRTGEREQSFARGSVLFALAQHAIFKRDAVLNQRGEVGRSEADTGGGLAIVLDVWRRVQMMRVGARQIGVLGMGLRI